MSDPAEDIPREYSGPIGSEPGTLANPGQPPRLLRQPPFAVPRLRLPLLGRDDLIATISSMLAQPTAPLVTLTGPGGSGKTRLAQAVAASLDGGFADGIWFVDLSPLRTATLVMETINQRLGIREVPGVSQFARLCGYLGQRQVLVILDNCEQVVDVASELEQLLGECQHLSILATSRQPFRLRIEQQVAVPPLAIPDPGFATNPSSMLTSPAVELFCRQARAITPDFHLDEEHASTVVTICRRLDGLPLAIELAASRLSVLPVQAIADRLEDRFALLSQGHRELPTRQQSIWQTIAWSYDLLSPDDQVVLRHLAVFAGGFTEAAASQVVPGSASTGLPMLDRLAHLIDANLIVLRVGASGSPRYTMLETIREFGLAQANRHGEMAHMRQAHAAWLLRTLRQRFNSWFTLEQTALGDELDQEHDNIRAMLDWLETRGEEGPQVEAAGLLWPFWFVRSHWSEGQYWLNRALDLSQEDKTLDRLRILIGGSCLNGMLGDVGRSSDLAWEAEALETELGRVMPIDNSLMPLGVCAQARGDLDEAARIYAKASQFLRQFSDVDPHALGRSSLPLSNLAHLTLTRGNVTDAEIWAEEALAIQTETGFDWAATGTLLTLGQVAEHYGDIALATARYQEGLRLAIRGHDLESAQSYLGMFAGFESHAGRHKHAVILLGACDRLQGVIGHTPSPESQHQTEIMLRLARRQLGPADYDECWQTGHGLELPALANLASGARVPPKAREVTAQALRGITRQEYRVLQLLSQGLTDQEIANELFIGRRTVNTHVSRLLAKLEATGRREAVLVARDEGLLDA